MGIGMRRRVLLYFIGCSLLIFFILCVKREKLLIWSTQPLEYSLEESRTRFSFKAPSVELQPPTPAARTTEPPIIGDSYLSEDIPPQTHCPDGIRSRITKTEFGKQFLKNIPVLQWAKHATPEQHQRLSQFSGAHGWRDISYKTLVGALSVLNSSANQQIFDDWNDRSNKSECIRCAVVGNGGILKDSRKGEEIDSHHYVFRANGVVTKGFEQDVGSRTTHYTFAAKTLMLAFRDYKGLGYQGPPLSQETRYIFIPDFDLSYLIVKAAATHTLVESGDEKRKDPTKFFGQDVSAEKLKMFHPDFLRYIRNRFLLSKNMRDKEVQYYRPSTGAEMLLAAMHTCDKVSAYGFITPDHGRYSRYYFDRQYRPVGFPPKHDFMMEMNLWQQLHQAGLVQLYMRERVHVDQR